MTTLHPTHYSRTDLGGIEFRVPKYCHICYFNKKENVQITEANSVVLSCRCDVAICRQCAKAIIAEQDQTFFDGVACPCCHELSQDIFKPKSYDRDYDDRDKRQQDSAVEVAANIDRLLKLASEYFQLPIDTEKDTDITNLYGLILDSKTYLFPAELQKLSIDEFSLLSIARMTLIIARLEATKCGEPDPLDSLRFLVHTSLHFAQKIATKESNISDIDNSCVMCMQDITFEPEDRRLPAQCICPSGCTNVLCTECSRRLFRFKNNFANKTYGPLKNRYTYIRCLTCSQAIACFLNSAEAQKADDAMLIRAVKKLTKYKQVSENALQELYSEFHKLGIVDAYTEKKYAQFKHFNNEYNAMFELAMMAEQYFSKHQNSKRSTRSETNEAAVATAAFLKSNEGIPLPPGCHIVVPKTDLFFEKCYALREAIETYVPPVELPAFEDPEFHKEVYRYDSSFFTEFEWFKMEEVKIYPKEKEIDSGDIPDEEILVNFFKGKTKLSLQGRLTSPFSSRPEYGVSDVSVSLEFSDLVVNVEPPVGNKRFDEHQLGVCVVPSTLKEKRVVLGFLEPSSSSKDITDIVHFISTVYSNVVKAVLKKSQIGKNGPQKWKYAGMIQLFGEVKKGSSPWFDALNKNELSEYALSEKNILLIICGLCIKSNLFDDNCQFIKFCEKMAEGGRCTEDSVYDENEYEYIEAPGSTDNTSSSSLFSDVPVEAESDPPNYETVEETSTSHQQCSSNSDGHEEVRKMFQPKDLKELSDISEAKWMKITSDLKHDSFEKIPNTICEVLNITEVQMGALLRQSGLPKFSFTDFFNSAQYKLFCDYIIKLPTIIHSKNASKINTSRVDELVKVSDITDPKPTGNIVRECVDAEVRIVKEYISQDDISPVSNTDLRRNEPEETSAEKCSHEARNSSDRAKPMVSTSKLDPRLRFRNRNDAPDPREALFERDASTKILLQVAIDEQYDAFMEKNYRDLSELGSIKSHEELLTIIKKYCPDFVNTFVGNYQIPRGCLTESNPVFAAVQGYMKTKIKDAYLENVKNIKTLFPALAEKNPSCDDTVRVVSTKLLRSLNGLFFLELSSSFNKSTELTFIANVNPMLVEKEVERALTKLCLCHLYYYDMDDDVYFVRLPMQGFPVLRLECRATNSYINARVKSYNSDNVLQIGSYDGKQFKYQRLFPVDDNHSGETLSEIARRAKDYIKLCAVDLKLKAVAGAKSKLNLGHSAKMQPETLMRAASDKLRDINELMNQRTEDLCSVRQEIGILKSIISDHSKESVEALGETYCYGIESVAAILNLLQQRLVFLSDEEHVTELEISGLKSTAQQQTHIKTLMEKKEQALRLKKKNMSNRSYNWKSTQRFGAYDTNTTYRKPGGSVYESEGSRKHINSLKVSSSSRINSNTDTMETGVSANQLTTCKINPSTQEPNLLKNPHSTSSLASYATPILQPSKNPELINQNSEKEDMVVDMEVSSYMDKLPAFPVGADTGLPFVSPAYSPVKMSPAEIHPKTEDAILEWSIDRKAPDPTKLNEEASCEERGCIVDGSGKGRRDTPVEENQLKRRRVEAGSNKHNNGDIKDCRRTSEYADDIQYRLSRELSRSRGRDTAYAYDDRRKYTSKSRERHSSSPYSRENDGYKSSPTRQSRPYYSPRENDATKRSDYKYSERMDPEMRFKGSSNSIIDKLTTTDSRDTAKPSSSSFQALQQKYSETPPEVAAFLQSKPRGCTERNRPKQSPRFFNKEKQINSKIQRKFKGIEKQEHFRQCYQIATYEGEIDRSSGNT